MKAGPETRELQLETVRDKAGAVKTGFDPLIIYGKMFFRPPPLGGVRGGFF